MKQLNVGVIGYGPQSASRTFHVPLISIQPEFTITTVSTLMPDVVRPMLPGISVVDDPNKIIEDPSIDLVIVAVPNAWHYEYAKQALMAGKHTVVEKPLAITTKEVDELLGLANEKHLLLTQFHNRRWDGGFLTTQKMIQEQRCGTLAAFEMNYDRWAPDVPDNWREHPAPGAGILYDLGVHLIDQTFALFGYPQSVQAVIKTQRANAQTDDYFALQLNYGHMQAVLRASMLAASPGPRYKISGNKGAYVKHGIDPQADMLNNGKLPGSAGWGEDMPDQYGFFSDSTAKTPVPTVPGAYQTFYEGIAKTLTAGAPPPVPPLDARNIIALIEAAIISNAEGRRISAQEIGFLSR